MTTNVRARESLRELLKRVCALANGLSVGAGKRSCYSLTREKTQNRWIQGEKDSFRMLAVILLPRLVQWMKDVFVAFDEDFDLSTKIPGGWDHVTRDRTYWSQPSLWVWRTAITPYLVCSLSRFDKIVFTEELFDECFDGFLSYVDGLDPLRVTYTSPILNADLPADEIEISDEIMLRKPSCAQLEAWVNGDDLLPIQSVDMTDVEFGWVIEITHSLPAAVTSSGVDLSVALERSYLREDIDRREVLGILRLISLNAIDLAFTYIEQQGVFFHQRSILFPSIQRKNHLSISRFGGGSEETIKRLWVAIRRGVNSARIVIPLRRWNDSFDRFRDEDRLIDLWIALESLFTPDFAGEIKFRGAIRIATFLGRNSKEKQKIYDDLRHSYDWRSTIVHGGEKDSRKLERKGSLRLTTRLTQDYLRQAILGILSLDTPFGPEALDQKFFTD